MVARKAKNMAIQVKPDKYSGKQSPGNFWLKGCFIFVKFCKDGILLLLAQPSNFTIKGIYTRFFPVRLTEFSRSAILWNACEQSNQY